MKAVPCAQCGVAKLADGSDYHIERFPHVRGHYMFRCARCKRVLSMTAIEFNRLPSIQGLSDDTGKGLRESAT